MCKRSTILSDQHQASLVGELDQQPDIVADGGAGHPFALVEGPNSVAKRVGGRGTYLFAAPEVFADWDGVFSRAGIPHMVIDVAGAERVVAIVAAVGKGVLVRCHVVAQQGKNPNADGGRLQDLPWPEPSCAADGQLLRQRCWCYVFKEEGFGVILPRA